MSVCPVRTVCWRFGTYGYQKSGHIGSYGYQKSKIIASKTSKPSKCKSLFELKPYYFEYFNRSSKRKRGMASNSLFIIPDFFLHFPNELCYGYLRFEGNETYPLVFLN